MPVGALELGPTALLFDCVAEGIFLIKILVVVLSRIKGLGIFDSGYNLSITELATSLQSRPRLFGHRSLFRTIDVDYWSVAITAVLELTQCVGGIGLVPINSH